MGRGKYDISSESVIFNSKNSKKIARGQGHDAFKDTASEYYSLFCPRMFSKKYTLLKSAYFINHHNIDLKIIENLKDLNLYSHVFNTELALESKDELIFGTDSLAALIPPISKKKIPTWKKELINLKRIGESPRSSVFRDKQLYDLLIDNLIDPNDNHPVQFAYKSKRDAESGIVVACPFKNNEQNHSIEVPGLRIKRDFKLPTDSSFFEDNNSRKAFLPITHLYMAESISGADVFRANWFYNKKEDILVLMSRYDNIIAAVDIWKEGDCLAKGFLV